MELENFQQEVGAHQCSLDTLWADRDVLSKVGEAQVEAQKHRVNKDLRLWDNKITLALADLEKSGCTVLEVDSILGGPSLEVTEAAAVTAATITRRECDPAVRQQQAPSSSWADEVEREWPWMPSREEREGWCDPSRRGGREEDGEDHNYFKGGSQDLPIKRLDKLADRVESDKDNNDFDPENSSDSESTLKNAKKKYKIPKFQYGHRTKKQVELMRQDFPNLKHHPEPTRTFKESEWNKLSKVKVGLM